MAKKTTDPIALARLNRDYPITSVCRMDLVNLESGFTEEQALKVTDAQMTRIARKLGDDYTNQLFWSSLAIIAENVVNEE